MKKKIVTVIGTGHCGSTLLDLSFSKKSKIRAAIGKLARHIYSLYNFISQWSEKSVLVDSSKQPIGLKVSYHG